MAEQIGKSKMPVGGVFKPEREMWLGPRWRLVASIEVGEKRTDRSVDATGRRRIYVD
jgi:hypothetical protein